MTTATHHPPLLDQNEPALSRSRFHRVLTFTLVIVVFGLVVSAGVWRIEGGSWFSVRSPSMGTAAPVGTLVLTLPVSGGSLVVGDIITFHPPTAPSEVYTHRIVSLDTSSLNDVGFSTQGDINGAPDPWVVHKADLIGKVTARVIAMGWVTQALPLLAVGGALWWLLVQFVFRRHGRTPARLFGFTILTSYMIQRLHPFVGITQLATVSDNGTTQVSLVSTGIMPIRVLSAEPNSPFLDLQSGQTGVLSVAPDAKGSIDLTASLHMPLIWWIGTIAVWLVPLLYSLTMTVPVEPNQVADGAS